MFVLLYHTHTKLVRSNFEMANLDSFQSPHSENRSLVIACWILRTNSTGDLERSDAIRASWGMCCDFLEFIDTDTPGMEIDWVETYGDLAAKSYRAWQFMHRKYLAPSTSQHKPVDFFIKADTDTYIVGHNLRSYLAHFDPNSSFYLGKRLTDFQGRDFIGGTSIILSARALYQFALASHYSRPLCSFTYFRSIQAEDVALAVCLKDLGILPHDTRDGSGAERFMVLSPHTMQYGETSGKLPKWYLHFSQNKIMGKGCCSADAIAFHYVSLSEMRFKELVFSEGVWAWQRRGPTQRCTKDA